MARPLKTGLEYFPHDTNASSDPKLEPLIILYGSKGYAFYFMHLEYIYKESDLQLNISDAETKQIFIRKLLLTDEEYEKILATSLKHGLFNKEIYDNSGCLTSKSINKRANIVLDKRAKMRMMYESKKAISDAETTQETKQVIQQETPQETIAETPQSKVKQSKVKQSKVINIDSPIINNSTILPNQIITLYNSLCYSLPKVDKLTNNRLIKLKSRINEYKNIEQWELLFKRIEASDFLTGRQERTNGHQNWLCSFDWIIQNDTNIVKVFEGKYDNKLVVKPEIKTRTIRDIKDVISREN